ncbi:uncharacterized protein LOC129574601 [Sitodiplosis mosellana]|uniref:uncharacterized protein LOC129574601 n=1 Tax=Sitodiplosis mosellana TaxID=263140 RepID=UPI00244506C6|nr:uncharacterized protein LOC129574601 [Sitodiplosis mosellana]
MCLQLGSHLILGFLVLVAAFRSENWPPKALIEHMDIPAIVKYCLDQCPGSTKAEMELFEKTTDLQNLPNSRELKCYMHCCLVESRTILPNSTRLNMENMMVVMEKLRKEDVDILLRLSRGCIKRTMNVRDPWEYAYILNTCAKLNDNEHYYFIY